jgi:hypothetical protein
VEMRFLRSILRERERWGVGREREKDKQWD